ncbi:MAG: DUF565 domain-containing protein [Synechococcales bacterium]|nr:DUF565 domain-containing protein [Synechococcales bacterium]
MQNTRLNSLLDATLQWLNLWLNNPWRRISLIIISLLFGNFAATVIATVTGQNADWDVLVALLLLSFIELSSWLIYSGRFQEPSRGKVTGRRPLILEMLNATKLGLIYGLFVEAFKLGS